MAKKRDEWQPGMIYLRHIDKEGKGYVAEHLCWHMGKFLAAAQYAAVEAGGRVEQVTQADYEREKKK